MINLPRYFRSLMDLKKLENASSLYICTLYFLIIPLFMRFYHDSLDLELMHSVGYSSYLTICVVLIYLILSLFAKLKIDILFKNLILVIIILISAVNIFLELVFQTPLNEFHLGIVIDSNSTEGFEFLGSYGGMEIFFTLLIVLFPFFLKKTGTQLIEKNSTGVKRKRFILSFSFFLISVSSLLPCLSTRPYYNVFEMKNSIVTRLYRDFNSWKNEYDEILRYEKDLKKRKFVASQNVDQKPTVVLVIGESLNRNRMSLYGYKRETTPSLDKLLIEKKILIFNDVISTNSYTRLVLPKLLTFYDSYSQDKWYQYDNIVNIFNKVGYSTYWLSNQEPLGVYGGNIAQSLSRFSDYKFFNSAGRHKSAVNKGKYDGDLIPVFNEVVRKPDEGKFIVVHLIGNHFTYSERYPKEFQYFEDNSILRDSLKGNSKIKNRYNAYDNSVRYNDFVVSSLISSLDEINNKIFVYVSDHGEEVYDIESYMGHNQGRGSRHLIEIPLVVSGSKKYLDRVENNIDTSYTNDDLIHTILDLASIDHPSLNKKLSLASMKNYPRKRLFVHKDYDLELKGTNSKIKNHPKVWLHRVNNLKKLKKASSKFEGIEIDIFYEKHSDSFDIKHKVDESTGLSLERFLSEFDPKMEIWLDLKNLSEENFLSVEKKLRALVVRFGLDKSKIILESTKFKILSKLKKSFYVSYYLPNLKKTEMEKNGKKHIEILVRNINSGSFDSISFPGHMYDFVKNEIGPKIDSRIEFNTWFVGKYSKKREIEIHDYINSTVVKDPRVRSILIKK